MIAVYHYNSLNAQEWNGIRLKLAQNGIKVKVFPSKVSMKALEETSYSAMSTLFRGCTAVAYSRESSAIKELLTVTKTQSKLHLLGGVVEKEIMSPLDLQNYSDLPPLDVLHQAIVMTINQTAMMLRMYIEGTQQRLSQMLTQISHSDSNPPQWDVSVMSVWCIVVWPII